MANLNLDRIFNSADFGDEGFDRPRWCDEGSNYTTLRRRVQQNDDSMANARADLTSTTAADSNVTNTLVHEIIYHDAGTSSESVMVSYQQLIPPNETVPLPIDDYVVSKDRKKVLIFTNAQKVWRLRTRGSYWILDLDASPGQNSLRQLGGGARSSCDLMYAAFSPDCCRVAYVRDNNIFTEELMSHEITQLTSDGSANVINGTFDWVYEEELALYRGYRWSPDGRYISYWQVDQSDVRTVSLVNNTDSLYPVVTNIPYPKCGQQNPSVRIGIVSTAPTGTAAQAAGGADTHAAVTKWIDLPGSTRDNYVVDLNYVPSTGELYLQRLNRLQNCMQVMVITTTENQKRTAVVDCEVSVLYTETAVEGWVESKVMPEMCWVSTRTVDNQEALTSKPFLHLSEKAGWRQLYLVNGDVMHKLTGEGFDVESVCNYDELTGLVHFIASPEDPLRRYLYCVDVSEAIAAVTSTHSNTPLSFSPPVVTRVTPEGAEYTGTNSYSLSKNSLYAVHSYSSTTCPSRTSIIDVRDHTTVTVLATNQRLFDTFNALNCRPAEFFRVPITIPADQPMAGDTVPLDGYTLFPPDFDPSQKYPVLFHVYGEPAAQIVRDQWQGRMGLWHRMLAQRGAVVMCIDNR